MAYGYDPKVAKKSPFHGAVYAVMDSVTKIVAMGGDFRRIRLTFQEYFEKLTEDISWGKPLAALLGALKVQRELEIPSIGGKDSMSGTFNDISVPPALISFAVTTAKADSIISNEFKKTGSNIVLVPLKKRDNGLPDFDLYKVAMDRIHELISDKKILAAHPVGRGGAFIGIVKMAVGNKIGAFINNITKEELLASNYGDMILEISKKEKPEELFAGIDYKLIGETKDQSSIQLNYDGQEKKYRLSDVIKKWEAPLSEVFPTRTEEFKDKIEDNVENISFAERLGNGPSVKAAVPGIVIPVFPGTNCEVDSKRAFEEAGGKAHVQIINNLSELGLVESINAISKKIRESQIIMIPGGFSGGDEPDGSAKFITAVFRNPLIREAVIDLMDNRDGLMLGICNGFQALIKLGLLPYGKITEPDEKAPTLTYNDIGRHQSKLVNTRIASVKSPWMANCEVGDIHTLAISHGEGKFVARDEVLKELIAKGQVATQYVDFKGNASMDIAYNPNHSAMAIEGITSPDGRIFGKMAHSERAGENIFKNVPGNKYQRIFEAGVNYFK